MQMEVTLLIRTQHLLVSNSNCKQAIDTEQKPTFRQDLLIKQTQELVVKPLGLARINQLLTVSLVLEKANMHGTGISSKRTSRQQFWKTDLFERNSSFSRITSCNYWKVTPQFVPLNGLHADICVLRISTVQSECVYIFVQ